MRQLLLVFCFIAISQTILLSQMVVGTDTLYGNEWIDYSKTYYKIGVTADGIYRIPAAALAAAGIPAAAIPSQDFRLYHNGQQTPLYISSGEEPLGPTDYIEFYGQKNRDEVDRHLFDNPDAQNLNPRYNLFNDTAAYFLAWESMGTGLRYIAVENILTDLPDPENYCWFNNEMLFTAAHIKRKESIYISDSWFDGEGFAEYATVSSVYPVVPQKLFAAGPNASLQIRYASELGSHQQTLRINDEVVARDTFYNWKIIQRTIPVSLSAFTPGLKLELVGEAFTGDKHSISYINTRYPRELDFSNAGDAHFELDGGTTGNAYRYLQIDGISGASEAVLLDLSTNSRYRPVLEGNQMRFKVKDAGAQQRLSFVVAGAGIHTVQNIRPVTFQDFSTLNANYVILTHPALMQGGGQSGGSAIEEYAQYRASVPGGGYNVATVDVTQLYDQFGYGIGFHPMSIRNFAQYIHRHWSNPQYLFFIGKGLNYSSFRDPATQASLVNTAFFVPVYGSPGTDWPFVMRKGGLSAPLLAVGRLAVTRPSEIKDYLNKVIERDAALASPEQSLANKAWMKTSIHTSGGSSAEERRFIANYVDELSGVLKEGKIGAEVVTLYKNSNDPVQSSGFNRLQEVVNKGVSMWLIFGHSSPNIVDYDIGDASSYQNSPRYPVMMVLGCYSGLASQVSKGLGEDFILAPKSGAINYIATSSYGLADGLQAFAKEYYQLLSGPLYGSSVGFALKGVIDSMYGTNSSSLRTVMHQMVLQGDPAVIIPGQPGPDYIVDNQSVRIEPNPVTINGSKYSLDFDLLNLGENKPDSIQLRIEQKLPNDSIRLLKIDTVLAPAFRSSHHYAFTADDTKMAGYNRILVSVDADNIIPELPAAAESNNDLADGSGNRGVEVYFYTDEVKPVYPPPFSIVPKKSVVLTAYAPYSRQKLQRFKFELDTLESFSSSMLRKNETTLFGGVVQWKPELELEEGRVYYWRVAKDTLIANRTVWQTSSFVALEGSHLGWNQSHFGQFIQNAFHLLDTVVHERKIDFIQNQTYAKVRVAFRNREHFPGFSNGFYEGVLSDYEWGVYVGNKNGVAITMEHPSTGHVIMNPPGGLFNPAPDMPRTFFFFETKELSQRLALIDFLENQVPDKSVVGLYAMNFAYDTIGYGPQFWANDSIDHGKNLFQIFEAVGAKHIRSLANFTTVPPAYGLIFQKGNSQFEAIDTVASYPDFVYDLRRDFPAKWFTGSTETSLVGPAKSWKSIQWARTSFDNPNEKARLLVYGVQAGDQDSLLYDWSQPDENEISSVDARQFPYLKISYQTTDSLLHTSADLRQLRVLFDAYPEGAIHPAAHFTFHKDTLEQGDPMRASIAFANISDTPMDSLLVRFRVENTSGKQDLLRKLRPLLPGDTLHASVVFPTSSLQGEQRLVIDVNPDAAQPELLHTNNVYVQPFQVQRDNRNPLLDVSFDGLHIMDGDLVSAKPEVVVMLKDDNHFIAISDPAAISLQVVYPDGQTKPLLFSDPTLTYFPATSGDLPRKNQAKLEWRPTFAQDGDYKLVVNGRDAAGNLSAMLDYSINFKVITKSSISNLLNYPNPFSTSTCFVYTMTGAESPSNFKVQIMTVSGRVVREITTAEFGSLQVGTHLSDYCWDGKDQFGDQLANGVYLYRVVAKKADGSNFEAFENQKADGYFKQGFGKMVLMR